jgi:hypothetical protein
LISPKDVEDRIMKVKRNELMKKLIVRLCIETKEQGGMLTETDKTILFRVTHPMISDNVINYENRTKNLL